MLKPYELHGIPENIFLEYTEPPAYAEIYEIIGNNGNPFNDVYGLIPGDIRLWGGAHYWTSLEAALLMVGVAPNDSQLYAVSGEAFPEGCDELYYAWKYVFEFDTAKDVLFLFERSSLAPKAAPIEWVKYFNTVRGIFAKVQLPGRSATTHGDEWNDFFSPELEKIAKSEVISIEKPLHEKERETLLVIIAALAKEAQLDVTKISKTGDLIANLTQLLGTPIGATTVETHLKKIPQALQNRLK